ncbi:hypothetical protein Adt_14912 [Abeliophyllum distichum]|uniref:Uncharacterized protein n=1 Tax=Abeliophyllum distichum TaxID=126358 RepID=A0ABD1U0Z7_9LAMI
MSSATGGNAQRRVEGEASPSVSPSMEGVLPIRGVDGNTGEALPIGPAPGLREASDPYKVEVMRWAALDVPSIMVEEYLTRLREEYRIPSDIDLIHPGPNERACFPRRGCTALHLNGCQQDPRASSTYVDSFEHGGSRVVYSTTQFV